MARLLYLAVALASMAVAANAHGWLMSPVPRSGGGTGSGNASTRRPCGRDGDIERTSVVAGQPFEVLYKRANNHGASGPNVDFTLSFPAATAAGGPTEEHFEEGAEGRHALASGLPMDVTDSSPQSAMVTVPAGESGEAVLQFKWQPRNAQGGNAGGAWYDCAYLTVTEQIDPACVEGVNPCDENAACTGETRAVCECNVGFFGNGRTCEPLPADKELTVTVHGDTVVQDDFTAAMAELLGVEEGRILFDRVQTFTVTLEDGTSADYTTVYFSIGADPESGVSGAREAGTLASIVGRGSSAAGALGLAAVTVDGETVAYGERAMESDRSASEIFGATFGSTISIAVLAAAGFFFYRRKQEADEAAGKVARPAYVPDYAVTDRQQTQTAQPYYGDDAGAGAAPAAVEVGGPDEGAWEQFTSDDGIPYWYNATTGCSSWTAPGSSE